MKRIFGFLVMITLCAALASPTPVTEANVTAAGPAAPSNLTATAGSSSEISLSWRDNSSDEFGFRIERCQGAGCTNFSEIALVSANTTHYLNTGLAAGATYRYRVFAFNLGGSSGYSNTAEATTQPSSGGPPAATSNLTATSRYNIQIDLSWTDNANNEEGSGSSAVNDPAARTINRLPRSAPT